MSRVAEALRRRLGEAVTGEAVSDEGHPWRLLGAAPEPDSGRAVVDSFVASPALTAEAKARVDNRLGSQLPSHAPAPDRATPAFVPADESGLRRQLVGLVHQVFLGSHPPGCTAFMSVGSVEGAAALTATTAIMVAEQPDNTVCVADFDLARPTLHQVLNLPAGPGIADALRTGAPLIDVARQVLPNLWAITAGEGRDVAPGSSPTVGRDLDPLRTHFDFVLVNLEPRTAWDAVPIVSGIDGVILVIDADATRRETARQITDVLRRSGTAVLGAVLTNRRYPIPDAVYKHL